MRATKLVLVEGLPGCGKSTTAQFLALHGRRHGVPARWFYEEEVPHPVTGSYRPEVQPLERWRAFAESAARSAEVTVLDGAFLQWPVMSWLTADAAPGEIVELIGDIAAIVRPLDSVLVYLAPTDVTRAYEAICARRGPAFTESHVQRNDTTPFARRRGVTGFTGLLRYWLEHAEICDRAMEVLSLPLARLEVSQGDWRQYRREICAFLALPPPDDARRADPGLARYVGTYRRADGDCRELAIELRGDRLSLGGVLWSENPLIRDAPNRFYVEAWPFELIFEDGPDGAIRSLRVGGRRVTWGTIAGVFERVAGAVSAPAR